MLHEAGRKAKRRELDIYPENRDNQRMLVIGTLFRDTSERTNHEDYCDAARDGTQIVKQRTNKDATRYFHWFSKIQESMVHTNARMITFFIDNV